MSDVDRASINRLAGEVTIAARDLRLNNESIGNCIEAIGIMDEKVQVLLEACTEDAPESDLSETLKALTGEMARNSEKLTGVEAALDRQTAAIAALLNRD